MASIIRIKRSSVSGNPATLAAGELAYSGLTDNGSNGGDRLYIGMGTETNGNAANHIVIGGKYFTDTIDAATSLNTADTLVKRGSSGEISVGQLTTGNILPSVDITYDLGSPTKRFKDLYLSGNSIYMDGIILTNDSGEFSVVDGSSNVVSINLNANNTDDLIEGSTNRYFTEARTRSSISASNGLSYNSNTGELTLTNTGVQAGSYGSTTAIPTFTVDANGRLTDAGEVDVATSLSIAGDTGTDTVDLLVDTLTVAGGEGIDVAVTNNTITVSGEDASSSNKGVASFDATNFTVTSGNVVINDITLGSSTLTAGQTTSSLAGLASIDVDNINIDGNEISATNTDGDISLRPDGNGTVSFNNFRATGLADPVNPQDAATKYYVDEVAQGLSVKPAVRAATTANLVGTYDNGTNGVGSTLNLGPAATLDIDGVTDWSQYDGILLKDQTNAYENGRFYVSQVGDGLTDWILTRCGKCDEPTEIPSMYVFVQEGTTYGSTGWVATVEDFANFDVGVDDITLTQFSGAGTYLAGDGLNITGNEFSVNVGEGLEISADNVQLAATVAGNGLTYDTGVLDVVGTTNRITVNADSIDIASTYVGQSSITTLGTITTGTWNATTLDVAYGGTGATTLTSNGILYGNGTGAVQATAQGTDGYFLYSNNGTPAWTNTIDGGTY